MCLVNHALIFLNSISMDTQNSHTKQPAILTEDQTELFGLNELTEGERAAFLDEVGSIVLESALLRYVTELGPEEQETLEAFVAEHSDSEELLTELERVHPRFGELLREEIAAFKEEAQTVLG